MGLNRNPNVLEKRETIAAGLLLGLPATVGGGWLLWHNRRQQRLRQAQHLRATFFTLLQAKQGKITPLALAMAANVEGAIATAYLRDRSLDFDATFQVDAEGNVVYCFPVETS